MLEAMAKNIIVSSRMAEKLEQIRHSIEDRLNLFSPNGKNSGEKFMLFHRQNAFL